MLAKHNKRNKMAQNDIKEAQDKTLKTNAFPSKIAEDSHIHFSAYRYSFVPPDGNKSASEGGIELGKVVWTCDLYPPAGIVDSVISKWNVEGVLGSVASGNMNSFLGALGGVQKAKGFGENMSAGADAGIAMLRVVGDAGIGAMAGLLGDKISNSVAAQTGQMLAPNEMLVYKGAGNKNVTFAFEMIPSSAEDALQIRQIVNRFKQLSSSFYDGSGLWGAMSSITAPYLFDIEVRTKNFKEPRERKVIYTEKTANSLIRFNSMAVTDFSATYGGGAQAALFHNDGSPLSTILSMTFQSVRPIHRTSTDMGLPEEDVI